MNLRCFFKGHDFKRLHAVNGDGIAILGKRTPGAIVKFIPVLWCKECGKVVGRGWL
ncbi:hypothetical protein [Pseudomonas nitroreducens]|uniref:hypothetical protein n=1 Tax=Pseudomonas nitroreducens TaxID=46680 RepID=UPI002658646E|nr:hypothetical protein [Pseudomonas nitroreducens]MCP1651678.1 hypothetical protein [Pseudomonas nitroreducens]MCP1684457.1 hypothetical protein [Pseudomonas nitroreducens]